MQIGQLATLETLKASHNMLKRLPHNMHNLRNLKHLDVSRNGLLYLPENVANLNLNHLNISHNAFLNITAISTIFINTGMLSLTEWSAKSVLKHRFVPL